MQIGRAAAASLLLVVLLTSCGSGGSSEADHGAKVIANSEFVAKAQPICKRGTARIGRYYSHWGEKARLHADSEEFMNEVAEKIVIPVRTEELKRLRALGLPEGKEKKLEAFFAAMEEGIEEGKRDRRSLRGSPYAFQRAYDMAASLGLQACFLG